MAWTFKDYYRKNRRSLLAKKRRKYRTNRSYRESVRKQARRRYYTKVKSRQSSDRTVVSSKDGRQFISIGKVSKIIGRTPCTIRQYHRSGVLPKPLYFDRRGWRLYTKGQVLLLKKAFQAFDEGKLGSLTELGELVLKKWKEA